MRSALIIGGDSTIGSALASRLHADGINVHTTGRRGGALQLDLVKLPDSWPKLPQTDVAYLCAAVTSLDACENDPGATSLINVTHMQALASRFFQQKTYVVFLSTNQVFDGSVAYRKANEPPCPLNAYGKQKTEFERWLLAQPHSAAVLRLTKVIAGRLPILDKWTTALKNGNSIEAFDDLVFAPLPLGQVIEGLVYLGNKRPRGIFQLSGAKDISYYEIASALAKRLGVDASKVKRASAKTAGIKPQFLPRHGTLQSSAEFAHLRPADALETMLG